MSGSIPIQIRGTPTPNNPPIGLAERQLAVEMASGNLWCGVPVSVDPTGRIMLNPRRVPADGTQYQALIKGTGANFGWVYQGDQGNGNTGLGSAAATAVTTANNTVVGANAMVIGSSGGGNTAVGQAAGSTVTGASASNGVFIGRQALALASGGSNEVVIGANTTGHGSNTVSFPATATQLWCGGRDLMVIGEPPGFGMVQNTIAGLPNDGSVQDIVSCPLGAGLWLLLVRVWMATTSGTPWYHYAAGTNQLPGQTSILDANAWTTAAGSVFSAAFSVMNIFRLPATTTYYGCTLAANGTNAGVYTTTVTLEPFQLSS